MTLLELAVYEVVARDDWDADEPGFADRGAVRFAVARMAEGVDNAEAIADPAWGRQQLVRRTEAFERHVLRTDNYGKPRFVEAFDGFDPSQDVLLDAT